MDKTPIFLINARQLKQKKEAFEKKFNEDLNCIIRDYNKEEFINYLKTLSYEKAKETIENLEGIFKCSVIVELKKSILEEIKLRDYPALDGAYHFPILNGMEFLSKDKIKKLDKYLATPRVKAITLVGLCRKLEIKEDKSSEVIDYLLDKDIIENEYVVLCKECYYDTVVRRLSKEEYEKFKKIFEVSEKDLDEMTEEELDIYNNKYEDYISVFCSNCDNEVFIDDLDSFKKNVAVGIYFNIVVENMGLNNIHLS